MEAIDTYQIDRVIEGEPTVGPFVSLSSPPDAAALRLPGRYIKAQFHHNGYDLVILAHGLLHEELAEICLIKANVLVENIGISSMLQADDVQNITITDPGDLSFEFPEDQLWQVTLHDKPVWIWPFSIWSFRIGITRSTWLRSHMTLRMEGPGQ